MKTIEELTNLGAAAALAAQLSYGDSSAAVYITPQNTTDQPAREAFARAVRDAVLDDQPAADVPTWRPIAEHDDDGDLSEYVYWDGEMSWHGNFTEKHDATHFIAHPPKPDPFEVWYAQWLHDLDRHTARMAYDAAREAKA